MAEISLTSVTENPWSGSGTTITFDYSLLGFVPSSSDSYKSTSGDVFKVFVDGVRIYRDSDSSYASGTGFLEDGDVSNTTLNGVSASWGDTSDNVWTINTTNETVTVDTAAIALTAQYGSSGLNTSFTSGTTIIELRRSVQNQSDPSVDFSNASILTEQDLDNSSKNVFHMSQQAIVTSGKALPYVTGSDVFEAYQPGTTTKKRITQVATPTADNDAATKAYVDSGIGPDITTVAGIASNVTTVAGISTNVTTVAGISADVTTVAGQTTEVGRLGTADAVADMNTLGTADVVADMNTLGTADVVADMNTLGTADVVADLNTLGTADVVSDMNTLGTAGNVTNMNTLAGISSDITTVSGISSDVTTVATNDANVTTVATNINSVNDFADRYRVTSDVSSLGDLDDGDLAWDTSVDQMKVYDLTGTAWTSIGQTEAQTTTIANNAAVAMAIALG